MSFSLPEIFSLIFLYAATDYKFKYFVSYLRKKTADIVTDIPYRVGPGVDIPLLFLAHDPSKYPFTLRKLTAEIFASGKKISAVDLVASSQQFSKPMAWQVFYIPRPAVSGWVEITVSFEIEERGKNRIYVADNYRTSSGAPFRVYLSDYTYPLYDGYIGGDVHTHSDLTNDQVEFGAPFEASIELARALELGFFCVTDHSYDLDDEPGNFLQNDPAIPKWLSLHQRIDRLNSSSHPVTVVRGEEATCRNERGKNVHLLLFGGRTFVPGSGDGAEKWLRTKSEHSIAEAIARGDAPVRVSAHPFEPVHILQQYLLGRSEWTLNDLRTKGMSGMQIFNGIRTVSSLRAMKAWTHLLLEGKKFFAFAGTDAHGNFNRFRQVYVPFVWIQEHHHQLFGSFRTVVALTHDSEREQDILNAFSRGESYITDGPAVEMNVRKPSGAITRMGGALTSSSVTVEVRALSSPEFGTIERLLLYVGDISLKKEKMISILQPREPQCGLEVYHQLNIEHHCYVRCEVVTSAQNDFDKKPHFCYSNPIWITPA